MRILILGAYGFLGAELCAAFLTASHEVICGARDIQQAKKRFPELRVMPCDFSQDIHPEIWLPRLANIDIVINCVGILQSSNAQEMQAVHYLAPRALCEACIQAGVKKFVHISAIGADEGVATPYAKTKLAFERYLQSVDYAWVILRPSLVYGRGAYGGTALFRGLASLPGVIPLVGKGNQIFQPIFMEEVTKAAVIVCQSDIAQQTINLVGPERISLLTLLIMIRHWLGFGEAKIVSIPLGLIRIISYIGDCFKESPLNSTSYKMLQFNNVADPIPMIQTLGFTPTSMKENLLKYPSTLQDRWHARLYFLNPLLRVALGLLWLLSGLIPLFSSHQVFYDLFAQIGLNTTLVKPAFYASVGLDMALGIATLINWRLKWIAIAQILVILFYTIIISCFLPQFWLDPFGAILKNIPLLVATLIMLVFSGSR